MSRSYSTARCCSSRRSCSLGEAFSAVRPWAEQLYASGDYSAMLKSLAPLKMPVDRFFDDVMVNVDDAKCVRTGSACSPRCARR